MPIVTRQPMTRRLAQASSVRPDRQLSLIGVRAAAQGLVVTVNCAAAWRTHSSLFISQSVEVRYRKIFNPIRIRRGDAFVDSGSGITPCNCVQFVRAMIKGQKRLAYREGAAAEMLMTDVSLTSALIFSKLLLP